MKLAMGKRLLFSGMLVWLLAAAAGVSNAQDFLTGQAERLTTAPETAELGYVESANGALHLEIPLGAFAQRGSGGTLQYRLVYDSSIWSVNSSGVWSAPPVSILAGWRQNPPFAPAPVQASITNQPPPPANPCDTTYSDFNWTDPAGAVHFFPVKTIQLLNPPSTCATDTPTGDAFATDSSGYHLYVTNYINSKLYAPDGTLVSASPRPQDANGNNITSVDSNGNYLSYFLSTLGFQTPSQIYDTAGHAFPQTSSAYVNPVMPTSQGSSTFTITYATFNVKTAFGQAHVTECTTNCTIQVIQSIQLPDGNSYTFQYDCDSTTGNTACGSPGGQAAYYGVMTSMTLPSGGQVTYSYTNFSDSYANKSRWLNSRTSAGGTWTYTPTVLTTCASQQVGCKEKVIATKPNGDRTEYTFVLNNGTWPVQTDYFDGLTGNLLSSVFDTWDFSINCPLTNCFGAAYIRKTLEAVTLPVPGGTSITRQTEYDYDSPQSGNIVAVKEWNYAGSGGFSLFPDKAKYLAYLNTGTNNINRPTKITVCSGVGSDPDCNGTGNKIAQTKTTYDSYGASSCRGVSGLVPVTGITNHDDSNFGTGYTTRGNPTSVQRWVSGTTFLTTNYFYDTTGQPIQETDPAGNTTCYDYTDNFFTDNGSNPPKTFTAPQPTNTYLTGITRPVIGKESRGYYFGSGKEAFFTDQNGSTTYSHYIDPLDRATGTIFPIGWNLTAYTSATQIDSYVSVGDASPSTACTSCQHRQTIFDNLGRSTSQKLINDPGGTVNVDTVYDSNGRVQSVSHPYIRTTDPEHVFEQTSYDGLDRTLLATHPDNQANSTSYGAQVAAAGGLSTQQGSTSTYGIAYPVLASDEAGKLKQKWIDGFNRVVEVDEPGGEIPSSAGTASGSVFGSEESFQTLVTPATSGSGSVQISGAVQWKTVSNASTGGTTSIAIGGAEQQNPVGVIAGSGTVTISGTEQVVPAVAATGSVTVNGTLQSKQVLAQAATQATLTVAISGEGQCGDMFCSTADSGTVTITVGSHSETLSYGGLTTARTIATNMASQFTANSTQVSAVAVGAGDDLHYQIRFTARNAGASGNSIAFSASQSSFFPGQFPVAYTFGPGSGNLGGGQDAVFNTIYDSGSCTITVNNHGNPKSWSGSGTTASNIASALATNITNDGAAFVNGSSSGGTVTLTARTTGVASDYSLSSSCSFDSTNFSSASFTTSNSGSALAGGKNALYDAGTFSATVNGHTTTPPTSWGQSSTAAAIATDLAAKINADSAAAVTASASGAVVTLTAKIKGTISNYAFSVASTYDSTDFSHASFTRTDSGANLTGGWPNPNAVDSGTLTVTVNGHNYPVNWGQSDTPGSIATNLVSAISADASVTPTLSGTTVYLNPKQPGTAYSFTTAFTYDSADFTHSSFTPSNSISDWGNMLITVNGHQETVPWAGLATANSLAAAVAGKINGDPASVVVANASGSTTGLTASTTGASTNYALASSTSFDSTDFAGASFTTCNTNPTSTGSCTSSNSVTSLAGGADAVFTTTYDTGTVTATVNGFQVSVPYQQGSTGGTLAAALANAFNTNSSSPVTATVSGASITLTAAAGTNFTISTSSSTSQPVAFGDPSFTLTLSENLLNGGSAPGGSLSTPLVTLYTYDAADRLTQVVQGAQTRTYVYDGLGRVTSETTPEAGTLTRSYNTSGGGLCSGDPNDVCSTTDARGVVTNYTYDGLSRLLAKSYVIPSGSIVSPMPNNVCTPTGSQTQANTCVYYDQGGANAFALGRPTKLVDPSGEEDYTYDSMGEVTQVKKTIGAATYTLAYQYNAGGDLTNITYPSGRVVQQSYDAIGQLCEVAPSTTGCATAASPYGTGYSYDPAGHLTGFNYGNGVSANLSYSPDRSELTALSYKKGTQTLFSLNYLYKKDSTNCPNASTGNNGQVQCILDNVDSGRTASYGYDALHRLTTAVTNGSAAYPQWGLRWDYDRYGNRTNQSVTAGIGPAVSVSFNQLTNQANGATYDPSGNLIVEPLSPPNDYTYDGENRMTSTSGGGGNATYTYDGHDFRVIKAVQGGTSTVSIFSGTKVIAEYDNGAAPASPSREYIYSNVGEGALLATISGGTTAYNHADHLSVRLVTDGTTGQVVGQQAHFPYGEPWYQVGPANKWFFTTYQRDSETGLDYALARFYNNRVASFCSVDPVEGNVENPQSWNRYAYVGGDPIGRVDVKGQFPFVLLALLLADLLQGMFLHGQSGGFGFGPQGDSGGGFDLPFIPFIPPPFIFDSSLPKQLQQPPQAPQGYIACPPVWFTVTGIDPHQAPGNGSGNAPPPRNGQVAINPKNYGLSTADAHAIYRGEKPGMIFHVDWDNAKIIGHGKWAGKTYDPTPGKGPQSVPNGLPVDKDQGLSPGDTIGGVNRSKNVNRIDLYRYGNKKDARASERSAQVTVFIPYGLKAHCPH